MPEFWKLVPHMPGVLASTEGRILLPPGHAPVPNGGYRSYITRPFEGTVRRSKSSAKHVYRGFFWRGQNYKSHQVVCAAFHGPKPFDKAVVIHLDENALNNRPENLKWGTQKENLNAPGFIAYCKGRVGNDSPRAKWAKAA
jgi:hypothetical protein